MSRIAAALVMGLLASALVLTPAPEARSALVWDRVTLAGARGGLTAVAVDPDDPRIVWVAGKGSVWVTDDDGDTWSLVAHFGARKAGNRRGRLTDDDDDDDGSDDDDDDDDRRNNDDVTLDENGNPIEPESSTRVEGGRTARLEDEGDTDEGTGGARIHRLRIIKDQVYVCADQGLFTLSRKARSMGGLREVRFGQTSTVYDIAVTASSKQYWIATPFGLLSGGVKVPAVPVFGPLGSHAVKALLVTPDGLYAGDHQGLWQQKGTGFVRLAMTFGRAPIEDLVPFPNNPHQVAVVTSLKVHVVDRVKAQMASTQSLPGMERGTVDRQGRLWVGGTNGAWLSASGSGLFRPRNQGLSSRVVAGVAAPSSGTVFVWAVGGFGAARLVTEAQRVWNDQARALAKSREGMPTAWDVVQATYRSKRVDLESVGTDITLIRLSWLLPDLFLRYERVLERDEDRVFVPALQREILDSVRVVPVEEQLQFQFVWDLSPLIFWAPEVWTPPARKRSDVTIVNQDTTPSMAIRRWVHTAVQERRRTNKKIIPLYNEWVNAKVQSVARPPGDIKRAIRERLRLQHLEADLFAYTAGWFKLTEGPDSGSTAPAQ